MTRKSSATNNSGTKTRQHNATEATMRRTVRIGMITPSSNTCLEPMTYRLLGGRTDVTVHFARVPVTAITLDDASGGQFAAEPMLAAARLLADAEVDVIAWNGTAGSWLGVEHDEALCQEIRQATGIPATTATLALLAAFRAFGVTRVGLAVPYTADVAARIADVYANRGVQVVGTGSAGLTRNHDFGTLSADAVTELADTAAHGDNPHAVAVVCTNVHGAHLAADFEARQGIPLLDSVAATVWHALDLAGTPLRVDGWGTLLGTGRFRARCQDVLDELLAATGADRTTLRLDVPELGLGVDLTTAEARLPGVPSIRREGSLDQRALHTVRWLDTHRRDLVQPLFDADPRPPQALIDVYGVRAQLLGPIERGGDLTGWLSVHSLAERDWRPADRRAVDLAKQRVHAALDQLHPLPPKAIPTTDDTRKAFV